jgi:hypothetical protein
LRVLVLSRGCEGFDSPRVADLAERLRDGAAHLVLLVAESADEGLDGAGVTDLTERLSGRTAQELVIRVSEVDDQWLDGAGVTDPVVAIAADRLLSASLSDGGSSSMREGSACLMRRQRWTDPRGETGVLGPAEGGTPGPSPPHSTMVLLMGAEGTAGGCV